ncbi:MAG: ATP-binding protein [Nitrospirae bacterium]|nr:ATP-binding protein [Nitrospirota bacterium]
MDNSTENSTENSRNIKLSIDSRFKDVSLLGYAIRGICSYLSLDETATYHIELSVIEVVNNVIKHSYDSEPGHRVDIEIVIEPDKITFNISDNGKSMDCRRLDDLPIKMATRDVYAEGGWGLFIISSLMDEMNYETVNDLNRFTISKKLQRL